MPEKKPTAVRRKKTSSKIVKPKSLLTVDVIDLTGSKLETVNLPHEIFSATGSPILLATYIRVYQSGKRMPAAPAKTRADVAGSTRKIYRQKGTGRARHGDIKAPIFVGGGAAHGPKLKHYTLKLNKKQRRKALYVALTNRLKKGDITFISGLKDIEPKTKIAAALFERLKMHTISNVLIIYPPNYQNLIRSASNIKNATLKNVQSLNAFDIIKANKILFSREALEFFTPQHAFT